MATLQFTTENAAFRGVLHNHPIAQAIVQALPISSMVQRWGEEIYFDVPVRMANLGGTRDVKIGDLAFWPDGPSLCIFFGRTPASKGREPRPAGDVTVIGTVEAPVEVLHGIREGGFIVVSHAT